MVPLEDGDGEEGSKQHFGAPQHLVDAGSHVQQADGHLQTKKIWIGALVRSPIPFPLWKRSSGQASVSCGDLMKENPDSLAKHSDS